ncbi:hypothetical protein [Aestuariivita sp.]|uniref:hypothetical protein n=1 Tax=Aestuariivita sp. TaxID=1872407 RepID=UPI00216ED044|nr:hypothetical protein [Aestuariivita sp.]MCE8006837.1 hypothetical protein [Aestuariivita sp.]
MAKADETNKENEPKRKKWHKAARGALQVAGAVPFVGGIFSAAAGYWSEQEQKRLNEFIKHWLAMMEDEMREKQQTVAEIAMRLDLHDEAIAERVSTQEYKSLVKKAFRDWAGAESNKKREFVRNILSNAAATDLTSDDVVHLFLDWLHSYSELHFLVIAEIYNNDGITRGEIWQRLRQTRPREDSAEADLYKLLFHDLSTGHVIRQHRPTDAFGNFIKQTAPKRRGPASQTLKSAFDDEKGYELTSLGRQFVHYAMTEVPPKLEYHTDDYERDSSVKEGELTDA